MRRLSRVLVGVVVMVSATTGASAATAWLVPSAAGSHGHARSPAGVPAPSSMTATCQSAVAKKVVVSWTAVVGATQYTVYDSTTGSGGTYASLTTTASLTFTTLALANATYWFEVSAKLAGGTWVSLFSAPAGPRVITSSGCT